MQRHWMTADISAWPTDRTLVFRNADLYQHDSLQRDAHLDQLAALMLDAYRGTIDDGGETLDDARNEVSKLFSGAYGTLDDASRVWRHRTTNMLVSATVITRDALGPKGGSPTHEAFLAFSLTHPTHQRQGLARMGLMHAMQTLRTRGEQRMHLVVTQGNTRAEALYTSMGFIKRD